MADPWDVVGETNAPAAAAATVPTDTSNASPPSMWDRFIAWPGTPGGEGSRPPLPPPPQPKPGAWDTVGETPQLTTPTGVAKNAAAATAVDIPSNIINLLTNPNPLHPIAVGLGTAYDALAPTFGLPRMTPEQRSDLYGLPQPGETQLPPEQQSPGTRVMNAADAAIPGSQKASNLPATPLEADVRTGVGAAGTVAALGPGGILAPAVAGVSAVGAPKIAEQVPDWAKPGTELATNVVPQVITGGLASRGAPTVDAANAATIQLARDKYNIPLNATDITPGSQYRTPGSVQASTNAFEGNIVTEMGENPNTPDILSRNRVTTGPGGVMDRTATRVGQVYEDIANRTNINPAETNNAITTLANLDHSLDLEPISDAQKAAIRRNIDLVQNAAVKGNGTISGSDYLDLTRTNTPIDKLAGNSDPNVAAIGMQVKKALTDAFQNSASPADRAALTQANYQWRLMKTVQPLAEKAQGSSIDPGAFADRAVAASRKLDGSTGGIAYTGGGNIGELARIGRVIGSGPTPVSPSLWSDILHPPGGGVGYMLDPKLEAIAHGTQVVGRQVAGPYLRSGFNTQQVINNALYRPNLLQGIVQGAAGGSAADSNQLLRPAQ